EPKPEPKPAAAKSSISAESAADRIMRRLDEEFPKTPPGTKPAAPRPAERASAIDRRAGTTAPAKASNRLTLSWRISLRWPEAIAPGYQVK
ncbi:MAG: hypothetical protein WCQ64_09055, partial [Acidobacteriota bacterium]